MSKQHRKKEQKDSYNGAHKSHSPQWGTSGSKGKKRTTEPLPSTGSIVLCY